MLSGSTTAIESLQYCLRNLAQDCLRNLAQPRIFSAQIITMQSREKKMNTRICLGSSPTALAIYRYACPQFQMELRYKFLLKKTV